jgi:glucose/mannose-6-phosphate isomerase
MLSELMQWPSKLAGGRDAAHSFYCEHGARLPHKVQKIVFVGMGGSGIAGAICKTFFDQETNIVVTVADGPIMPGHIDEETLAIVSSYSGNTWETVDVLRQLVTKKIPSIVITHGGGRLAEVAMQNCVPVARLGQSLTPRSALGQFLGFLLALFDKMGMLEGESKIDQMSALAIEVTPQYEKESAFSTFLEAAQERDFFHVWGVQGDMAAFAYRAATQFNENSKVQAAYASFPEVCHNVIASFCVGKKKPLVVFFASGRVVANLDINSDAMSEILTENGVVLYKPPLFGDTWTEQLFHAILWSDFASYHLANMRNVEVAPVTLIEALKAKQKSKGIS